LPYPIWMNPNLKTELPKLSKAFLDLLLSGQLLTDYQVRNSL
jgi:hypothetical protein